MRYCPVSKVGSIDAPETIKGCATKSRTGTTIMTATTANLRSSVKKFSLFSCGMHTIVCFFLDYASCAILRSMQWVIAGLGNPGKEYDGTRHNTGRDMLMLIEKKNGEKGRLFGKKILLIYPDVYMNNSGSPIKRVVTSKKAAENLIVLHDEL